MTSAHGLEIFSDKRHDSISVVSKPEEVCMWLRAALFCAVLGWSAAVGGAGRVNAAPLANHDTAHNAVDSAPRPPLPSEPPAPRVDARTVWVASAGVVVVLIVGGVLFVHRREHSLPHPPPARS